MSGRTRVILIRAGVLIGVTLALILTTSVIRHYFGNAEGKYWYGYFIGMWTGWVFWKWKGGKPLPPKRTDEHDDRVPA